MVPRRRRSPKPRVLVPKDEQIRQLLEEGWTVREIAVQMKCSPAFVRRVRREPVPEAETAGDDTAGETGTEAEVTSG